MEIRQAVTKNRHGETRRIGEGRMSIIKTKDKHGFEIVEYNGEYSLIATYENQGKDWQKWGRERVAKGKYDEKERPFKITLGDKKMAVAALQKVIEELSDTPF
jgi:hypothetical protein